MFCNEHGTLDYCPSCLDEDPHQRALAAARERVIEAARELERQEALQMAWVTRAPGGEAYRTEAMIEARKEHSAAVAALDALEGGR